MNDRRFWRCLCERDGSAVFALNSPHRLQFLEIASDRWFADAEMLAQFSNSRVLMLFDKEFDLL
jgi:hypothetical protein